MKKILIGFIAVIVVFGMAISKCADSLVPISVLSEIKEIGENIYSEMTETGVVPVNVNASGMLSVDRLEKAAKNREEFFEQLRAELLKRKETFTVDYNGYYKDIGTSVSNMLSKINSMDSKSTSDDGDFLVGSITSMAYNVRYSSSQASYTFTVNTNGTGAETECIYLVTNTGAFAWEQVELSPFILSESNVGMPWKYSTNDIYNTLPGKGYPIKNTSSTTIRLTPNVYTVHSGTPNSLTLMFGADEYDNTNNMKEYFIEFTTSSSGCSLAVPTTVKWLNGEVPVLEASTSYQLSIVNNLAVIAKFA